MVLYAMTAEKARLDPKEGAANLNALQWGWFAAYATSPLLHLAFIFGSTCHNVELLILRRADGNTFIGVVFGMPAVGCSPTPWRGRCIPICLLTTPAHSHVLHCQVERSLSWYAHCHKFVVGAEQPDNFSQLVPSYNSHRIA